MGTQRGLRSYDLKGMLHFLIGRPSKRNMIQRSWRSLPSCAEAWPERLWVINSGATTEKSMVGEKMALFCKAGHGHLSREEPDLIRADGEDSEALASAPMILVPWPVS